MMSHATLDALTADITSCRSCKRLVRCREAAGETPPKRFAGASYWGKAVPGFGDPKARLLVVGLAPAANGANRTGRVFTGDRSGDWLYGALYRAGFASQAESVGVGDGMKVRGAYIGCVVRCAPPGNRPTPVERDRCLPFLRREIEGLTKLRVILALGGFAWDGVLRALEHERSPRPKFGHGAEVKVSGYTMVASYHVSQQNTFTGRLTEEMLDAVMQRVMELLE